MATKRLIYFLNKRFNRVLNGLSLKRSFNSSFSKKNSMTDSFGMTRECFCGVLMIQDWLKGICHRILKFQRNLFLGNGSSFSCNQNYSWYSEGRFRKFSMTDYFGMARGCFCGVLTIQDCLKGICHRILKFQRNLFLGNESSFSYNQNYSWYSKGQFKNFSKKN